MLSDDLLASLKRRAAEGQSSEVITELCAELTSSSFPELPIGTQAASLRLRARFALLLEHDEATAESYAKAAAKLVPDSEAQFVLESQLALLRVGPSAAIDALKGGTGIESIIARASYLLASGRAPDGLAALEAVADGHPANAHVQRLLAVLYLAMGNRGAAEKRASLALDLAPADISNQETMGIVHFYACYPPALQPALLGSPQPMPPDLLTLDSSGRIHLELAASIFAKVLDSLRPDSIDVNRLELWRLAALATNPDREGDAASFASSLLYRASPLDVAVQWSKLSSLNVHEEWVAQATRALDANTDRPSQRLMLGWLNLDDKLYKEAVNILEHPSRNESDLDRTSRNILLARAFAELKLPDKALQAIAGEQASEAERLRAWVNEGERIDDGLPKSGDNAMQLLDYCMAAARNREWDEVLRHSSALLRDLRVPAAIRVVMKAHFNTKNFKGVLELYDEAAAWTGLADDAQTRYMRAMSLWFTDRRDEAIEEAKRLFQSAPTASNAATYAKMLFETGNVDAVALVSRNVIDATDMTATDALTFARALQGSHSHEAGMMWDRAIALGVPDGLVSEALILAYSTGRESQTEGLVHRMQKLAEQADSGITRATLDDLREIVAVDTRRAQELFSQYRSGALPIHIIADAQRLPLLVTHEIEPELNIGRQPSAWTSIYVRDGGRGPLDSIVSGALFVDMTSLVLSHMLGVLDKLPKIFGSVVLPAACVTMLYNMKERLATGQPRTMAYVRQVVDAIKGRAIAVIPLQDPFAWANLNGAFFVTSSPWTDNLTGLARSLTDDEARVAVNLPSLVESLCANGTITSWERDKSLETFGAEGKVEAFGPIVPPKARLLFDVAHIGYLQEAQLLGPLLLADYEILIDEQTRAVFSRRADDADRRAQAVSKIDALANDVRDGLEANLFELRQTTERLDFLEQNAKAISTLMESASKDDILLVDDRFCNKFKATEHGAKIFSTIDVLAALRAAGELNDDRYFNLLNTARRAGLFFIPLEHDELVYLLEQANIVEDRLQETSALLSLRHYLGAALKQPGLNIIPQDGHDERAFIRCADDAIAYVVRTSSEKPAWVDYLLTTLAGADLSALRIELDATGKIPDLTHLATILAKLDI